jgi:hypothetical protein
MQFNPKLATIVCALALHIHVSGCSPDNRLAEANNKLAKANQRIASLEAQLAKLQKNAPSVNVPTPLPPVSQTRPVEASIASGQQWRYWVSEEKMSGGTRRGASVESTNTVDFDFPYKGSQNGTVTLRIDPQQGKNVLHTKDARFWSALMMRRPTCFLHPGQPIIVRR